MASPKTAGIAALLTKTQEAELRRIITECIVAANQSLHAQVHNLEVKSRKSEKDVGDLLEKMAATEQDVARCKSKVTAVQKQQSDQERHLISLLWERSQKALRIQNIEEEEGEVVGELVSRLLSPLAELPEARFTAELKAAYRVSTRYTFTHGLPREICVKLRNEEVRGKILFNANKKSLDYQGTNFKILKDVPQLIRARREPFKELAKKLLEKGINYRWLIPQGLSFTYKGDFVKITSEKDINSFLEKFKAEFTKEETSGTAQKSEAKKPQTKPILQKRELRSKKK